uniref:Kinocilin n=1 Tax=Amphiprion percula TaxID=161767 RepID=A0A3P8SB40_AMPPE
MDLGIVGEYHGLRVGSALLSIVAGCIIIGVSRECDADAVGGIFLGAGGLGLLISIYPFIKACCLIILHPTSANPAPDQPAETLRREGEGTEEHFQQPSLLCSNATLC